MSAAGPDSRSHRARHWTACTLLTLLTLLAATGCAPDWMDATTLTEDQGDSYVITGTTDQLDIAAPDGNRGSNLRVAMTPRDRPATATGTACATWASESSPTVQEGIVLAWTGTRGVTVTKNVWAGVTWVVNAHTWDTTHADAFHGVGQWQLPGLHPNRAVTAFPWRMCATVTAAGVLSFRVWPLNRPEPAAGDLCCTGTVTVPGLPAGRAGWYIGHLPPGGRAVYTDLTTWEGP